jgi:hypothetical protein
MRTPFANLLARSSHRKPPFEIEEELQFHIDMLERKYAQQGMSSAAARAAALKRFGSLEAVKRQCVDISRRNSLQQRVLKASLVLIALSGLAIRLFNSDYKVARIGSVMIMIAVSARLLLYVRGLNPAIFPSRNENSSLSITQNPECS